MIRKLFSHTVIYGAAPHVSKLASFFVLPIVTQFLTPLDYGVFGVVTATIGTVSVFASMGLRLVLVNSFYKSPGHYKWLWRQVYGFLSLWIIPYTFISATLVYLVIPEEAKHNAQQIILMNVLPLIFFGQTSTLATTYYQINKRPLPIAMRTAIFGTITVLLNLYTIAVLKMGYMGWFWSNFLVGILNNVSYWIPLNLKLKITPIFNFKWRLIKNCLKVSAPTIPHYYSSYLLNASDKLVLKFTDVSTDNIGKYNAAYTFGNYFSNLGNASGLAIGPLLNECFKQNDDRKARNLIYLQQIVFFALSFTVAIWLKELFQFFIRNEELSKMYYLSVIIVMAYNYRPMYLGANAKLMYTEKTNLLWRVSFIAGVGNVLLNFILVPIFGFEAAAFTTFVSFMYMGYAGFFMKGFKSIVNVKFYPVHWLLANILLTAVASVIVFQDVIVKGIVSIVVAPVVVFLILRLRKMLHESKRSR
jgi:O-antigen/teichoic acid export membrane protein